jgi:Outer membrane protein beta-barrel family/CarboxypepD_reg-like domain
MINFNIKKLYILNVAQHDLTVLISFRYKKILLLLLLLISLSNEAQNISGKVLSSNKPLEFATVSLFKDTILIKTLVTDKKGEFSFGEIAYDKYLLTISFVGYKKIDTLLQFIKDLNVEINLIPERINQIEVTVTGKRPVITRKADRYLVNVENSFLATGYTALEILQHSPGLLITNDGLIKFRGNKSITVMINNVQQKMAYDELQEYLKTLKSENISKIEVITSPGAEFDAESSGGYVNIILKRVRKQGLQGNISANYRQQSKWSYFSPSLSLNYKSAKFSAYASRSYVYNYNNHYANNDVAYPNSSFYNTHTKVSEKRERSQTIGGVVYEIAKNQLLGVQNIYTKNITGYVFDSDIKANFNGQNINGKAIVPQNRNGERNSTTLNYLILVDSLGSQLNLISDYTFNNVTADVNFRSRYSNAAQDSIYRNNAPYGTKIFSSQIDFKKIQNQRTEWKTGLKFSAIDRDNDLLTETLINSIWVKDAEATNSFRYKEKISAAYLSVNTSLGKSQLTMGLRAEYTATKGVSLTNIERISQTYFNIFPSFSIQNTFNENKGNSLYFSFNMPFNRPDYSILNPYRLKIDNFTYQIGNPGIKPQTGYSFDAGVNIFEKYNIGVYYSIIDKVFANILTPKSNNIIEYQIQNFNKSIEGGLYSTFPISIASWWTTSTDLQVYNLKYMLNNYRNEQTVFFAQTIQNISIKKIADIDIISQYRSPYVYSNAKVAYQFNTDLGISRKILKGKGKVRFLITDIFDSQRDKTNTYFNNTVVNFYQKKPTRTFGLTISYNFLTGVKFNSKGVNQVSNEEKNRLDK